MPTRASKNLLNLSHYYKDRRTPDILDCIANLSSDEVFTPPELADKVLDLLPEEVWKNPDLRWLDPACKTGVFLRQIATRLMIGLRDKIPDEAKRREHIFKNMLYGMPITRLTALMSRRSVYYAKNAMSERSVVKFGDNEGNIIFVPMEHDFNDKGICKYCRVSKDNKLGKREADGTLENHAYQFIHLKEDTLKKMKFDVIVSNPPYQFNYGTEGANDSKAYPIYQLFIEQAIRLNPRYFSFIVPSKWSIGTKELFSFQKHFLNDPRIAKYYDFIDSSEIFPGTNQEGICYFVWDREKKDKDVDIYVYRTASELLEHSVRPMNNGSDTFIRMKDGDSIVQKCLKNKNVKKFMDQSVTGWAVYGVSGSLIKNKAKKENKYFHTTQEYNTIMIRSLNAEKNETARFRWYYVDSNAPFLKKEKIEKWKLCFPKSVGESIYRRTWICPPDRIFTDTWLNVFVDTEEQAKNLDSYFKTYLFRYLLLICCATRNVYRQCYRLVPDLSEIKNERTGKIGWDSDWTDEDLQKLFGITNEETAFMKNELEMADPKGVNEKEEA